MWHTLAFWALRSWAQNVRDVDFGGMVCVNHGTDFGLWLLTY